MRDQWKRHVAMAPQQEVIERVRKAFRAAALALEEVPEHWRRSRAEERLEEAFCLAERGIVLFDPKDEMA